MKTIQKLNQQDRETIKRIDEMLFVQPEQAMNKKYAVESPVNEAHAFREITEERPTLTGGSYHAMIATCYGPESQEVAERIVNALNGECQPVKAVRSLEDEDRKEICQYLTIIDAALSNAHVNLMSANARAAELNQGVVCMVLTEAVRHGLDLRNRLTMLQTALTREESK